MLILAEEKEVVLVEKKSKFIGIAKVCNSISNVKNIISETRAKHSGANHVVHACVVGNEFSYSDDKEPKNTAGKPAFNVLKGSGISNICVLIVRYFGGTLLGTGGLVKAYSDTVKLLLSDIKTKELVSTSEIFIKINYSFYSQVKTLFQKFNSEILSEKFEDIISLRASVPDSNKAELLKELSELTGKRIE